MTPSRKSGEPPPSLKGEAIKKYVREFPRSTELVDKHLGENFLICGNGSSLDLYPPEFYHDFPGITIGCNRIIQLFFPTYYLCLHKFERFFSDIDHPDPRSEMTTISCRSGEWSCDYWARFKMPQHSWNKQKSGIISVSRTSAVPMLSLAYNMGARIIFVIGIDFARNPLNGKLYFGDNDKELSTHHHYGWYAKRDSNDWRNVKVDTFFKDAIKFLHEKGIFVVQLCPWHNMPLALYGELTGGKHAVVNAHRPTDPLGAVRRIRGRVEDYRKRLDAASEPSADSVPGPEAVDVSECSHELDSEGRGDVIPAGRNECMEAPRDS